MNAVLLAMLAYVLVQFAIGVAVSRRMTSESDYILAGRSLGTGLVLFSVFATFFGAEAIVASAAAVYESGLSGAATDPFGYSGALVIVGFVFARPLWKRGLTTFADLFAKRYSPGVERLVVLMLLPGSIFWAAAQIRAFGQVISANSSLKLVTAITLAAILVAAYSVVGGLLADAVTDVVQGIAVVLGLVILFFIVAAAVGGLGAGLAEVSPERLRTFAGSDGSPLQKLERLAIAICGTVVAVELISRLLGARNANVAAAGTMIGGGLYLLVGLIPVFLGLVGPKLIPGLAEPEQIVPRLAEQYLPRGLFILFIGAQVSAILSTVHSALHAPSAQVSHNIVVRLVPGISEHGKLWSVRLTVMALSAVAFLLAISSSHIRDLVDTASAFGSAGVFVVTVFALFTNFGGERSAYVAMIAGMGVWAIGTRLGWSAPYLAGLLAALIGYVAIALAEPRPRA